MKIYLVSIILTLSFAASKASPQSSDPDYHATRIEYAIGKLGVCQRSVKFVNGESPFFKSEKGLKRAAIRIRASNPRGCLDGKNSVDVTIDKLEDATGFIVRGPGFSVDPISAEGADCYFPSVDNSKPLPTVSCSLILKKQKYTLTYQATGLTTPGKDDPQLLYSGNVSISIGKNKFQLATSRTFSFLWIGDLNSDGKLDFITQDVGNDDEIIMKLYVSDGVESKENDSLKPSPVAEDIEFTGC